MFSLSNKKGVILLWTAILALTLFAIGAFAVDLGNLWLVRNELQNTADAAALAAASALGRGTYREVYARARAWAAENTADGKTVNLNFENIEVGEWDPNTRTFTPSNPFEMPIFENNAVRVKAARTRNSNGPIQLCFGRLLGQDVAEVSADAIAVGRPAPIAPSAEAERPETTPEQGGTNPLTRDPSSWWTREDFNRWVEEEPYVMYILDTTDSMSDSIDEAKTLARTLLQWSESCIIGELITKVGLASFEKEPAVEQDLSSNVGAVYEKLDELRYGQVYPENAHNVASALSMSLEKLWKEPKWIGDYPVNKYIYLFSDGNFSEEEIAQALAEAEKAKAGRENKEGELERIPIYIFGISDEVNEEALKQIAEASGGEYLSAEEALAMCQESMDNYLVWLVR